MIEIEKTHIRKSGSSFLVDIHVVVMGTISVADGHKIGHDVKDTIIETEPRVKMYRCILNPMPSKKHRQVCFPKPMKVGVVVKNSNCIAL